MNFEQAQAILKMLLDEYQQKIMLYNPNGQVMAPGKKIQISIMFNENTPEDYVQVPQGQIFYTPERYQEIQYLINSIQHALTNIITPQNYAVPISATLYRVFLDIQQHADLNIMLETWFDLLGLGLPITFTFEGKNWLQLLFSLIEKEQFLGVKAKDFSNDRYQLDWSRAYLLSGLMLRLYQLPLDSREFLCHSVQPIGFAGAADINDIIIYHPNLNPLQKLVFSVLHYTGLFQDDLMAKNSEFLASNAKAMVKFISSLSVADLPFHFYLYLLPNILHYGFDCEENSKRPELPIAEAPQKILLLLQACGVASVAELFNQKILTQKTLTWPIRLLCWVHLNQAGVIPSSAMKDFLETFSELENPSLIDDIHTKLLRCFMASLEKYPEEKIKYWYYLLGFELHNFYFFQPYILDSKKLNWLEFSVTYYTANPIDAMSADFFGSDLANKFLQLNEQTQSFLVNKFDLFFISQKMRENFLMLKLSEPHQKRLLILYTLYQLQDPNLAASEHLRMLLCHLAEQKVIVLSNHEVKQLIRVCLPDKRDYVQFYISFLSSSINSSQQEDNYESVDDFIKKNAVTMPDEPYSNDVTVSRQKLSPNEVVSELMQKSLPANCTFYFGASVKNNDSLLDAVSQAYNLYNMKSIVDIKSLRKKCMQLMQSENLKTSDNWIKRAIQENCLESYEKYLSDLQYTQIEMNNAGSFAVKCNLHVVGVMLARILKINLHIVNFNMSHSHGNVAVNLLVTADKVEAVDHNSVSFFAPETLHLACYQDHFVPILLPYYKGSLVTMYKTNATEIIKQNRIIANWLVQGVKDDVTFIEDVADVLIQLHNNIIEQDDDYDIPALLREITEHNPEQRSMLARIFWDMLNNQNLKNLVEQSLAKFRQVIYDLSTTESSDNSNVEFGEGMEMWRPGNSRITAGFSTQSAPVGMYTMHHQPAIPPNNNQVMQTNDESGSENEDDRKMMMD